jgi:gluconate 2-dehydrogenase gamma chain
MSDITRREALGLFASIPLAATLEFSPAALERAGRLALESRADEAETGTGFEPRFFTAQEWALVRVLVDLVIPRDGRSGSATDAGVPEFMDFILVEYPNQQLQMRGGLAWLERHTRSRFGHSFVEATAAERTAVLDEIAWPARARPEVAQGVAFFTRFRDFTASGFFSSRVGMQDLRYMGNTAVAEWTGCPPEALRKLGVSY